LDELMTEINTSEELAQDWDWYACDQEGHVGHFTTAGLRTLPRAVKKDREGTEHLTQYFFNEAQDRGGYSVRPGAEADAGGWQQPGSRERFLKSFVEMARKGAFSYNTEMVHGRGAKYYLVAKPERPLRIADLPPAIREMVSRVRMPISFAATEYIPEADTLGW
jgi:hypothetical protein